MSSRHGRRAWARRVRRPAPGHGMGQGVVAPITAAWYEPILAELAKHNVRLYETVEDLPSSA